MSHQMSLSSTHDGEQERFSGRVKDIEINPGETLVITAGCSTGKSRKTRAFMKKLDPNARILVISVRKSHAVDAQRELNDEHNNLGFVLYDDFKGELHTAKRVICSLESLHRLHGALPFDVLILDECRSLANIFTGETLQNPKSREMLEYFYKKCRFALFLDADNHVDGAVKELLDGLSLGGPKRPIKWWDFPDRFLKRKMKYGFKHNLKPSILNAIRKGRVAIACGSKKQCQSYGKMLSDCGYKVQLYHGDTSQKSKRKHFQDPDECWEEFDAIIFTSSLSVGVDPRKCVFQKLFLHTLPIGATIRDLFQGLCRFGRFEGGLEDDTIEVCLECMDPVERALLVENGKLEPLVTPTLQSCLDRIQKENQARLMHMLRVCNYAQQYISELAVVKRSPSYIQTIQAWNELERRRNISRHFEEFKKFASHRGWSIEKAEVGESPHVPLQPLSLDIERKLEMGNELERYNIVRNHVEEQDLEEKFLDNCCGFTDQTTKDSALILAMRGVFYMVRPYNRFLSDDDYKIALKHKKGFRNYALLKCADRKHIKLDALEAHMDGLTNDDSQIVEAGESLEDILEVTLEHGSLLPDDVVKELNDEICGVSSRKETEAGKRRSGLQECTFNLRVRAESAKGAKGSHSLRKIKACLKKFGLQLKMEYSRKRKGNVRKRLITRAEIQCEHQHLRDEYQFNCRKCESYITVKEWEDHNDAHTEDIKCPIVTQDMPKVEGEYQEPLDGDAIMALLNCPPTNSFLKSSFNWLRKVKDVRPGRMLNPMTYYFTRYHNSKGYGRQYPFSISSLVSCPRILRHFVCGRYLYDVDIKNCYPNLVLGLARKHGVHVPTLEKYVNDREPLLRAMMRHYGCTRQQAKQLPIRILHGGKPKQWKKDYGIYVKEDLELVEGLLQDVELVRDLLLRLFPEAREIVEEFNRNNQKKKNMWSAVGYILGHLERECVMALEDYFTSNGWTVCVIVYDGLMIEKKPGFDLDLAGAEHAANQVMSKYGITIKLDVKPMQVDPVAKKWYEDAMEKSRLVNE